MYGFTTKVDAREIELKDKYLIIINAFNNLKPGEMMELTNDHDPRPLYNQLIKENPERFIWEYLEQGPEVWRVAIEKK